jgi:ammonia channel protein AmtB
MLMTPGLGLFYGGMVRRKNVLATFQQSFIMLGLITLQWTLFGYSLAFGPDVAAWGSSATWTGWACGAWGSRRMRPTRRRSRTRRSWSSS